MTSNTAAGACVVLWLWKLHRFEKQNSHSYTESTSAASSALALLRGNQCPPPPGNVLISRHLVPNGAHACWPLRPPISTRLRATSWEVNSWTRPPCSWVPSQTAAGPAIVTVEDVKLSGRISMLHLTLSQGGLPAQAPWVTASVGREFTLCSESGPPKRYD